MSIRLAALVRRRPALVLLLALYLATTVLVARSPLTVALCTALVASAVVQMTLAVRRATST